MVLIDGLLGRIRPRLMWVWGKVGLDILGFETPNWTQQRTVMLGAAQMCADSHV